MSWIAGFDLVWQLRSVSVGWGMVPYGMAVMEWIGKERLGSVSIGSSGMERHGVVWLGRYGMVRYGMSRFGEAGMDWLV